ncbi:MAG: DUF3298 domain-containing protein [Chlorobi bacterium]|nr:MAG: DUF3298 and DUF4163 domain-containing protein [Bacteroidota bacterium]KXK34372.1 MAG: hypothetical protein UZ06_CHB003001331 [Chlorobi bacterium OLB6]MBE2265343.1 DUF3298 domain-containing protein [Flavobacteriales bacterium]MBL1160194.1 DUF3298 domain-containing protein [Chlorobiota bacterium]MBW7853332.1 DUF3298 domain-containing protein [Candidatus Kapabacteria bacterium]MCC6331672.1 DUF3298 domain-containing protein [Ignavibacteria bacterium]
MRSWLLLCVGAVIVCAGCSREPETPPADPAPELSFKDSTVVVRAHGCNGLVEDCGGVEVHFPVFNGNGSRASDYLNYAVRAFFVSQLGGSLPNQPDTASAVTFPDIIKESKLLMADYTEEKAAFPMMAVVWTVQGSGSVICNDSIVCVQLEATTFLGGAHPNSVTDFVMVHVPTGKPVQLSGLVRNMKAFLNVAEQTFKKQVGIKGNDYAEKGYMMQDGKFTLPLASGITTDSVILYYNPYEIAPYVVGPTRISLPRTVLEAN